MRKRAASAAVAVVLLLSPAAARAGERVTDAAVGAVAGAVAAGPVGLIGGGIVGYVAGPQIACDIGVKRCYRHARYRRSGYGPRETTARDEGAYRSPARGDHSDVGTRPDHGNY
jgi:hypothetical protein